MFRSLIERQLSSSFTYIMSRVRKALSKQLVFPIYKKKNLKRKEGKVLCSVRAE
jgi:hypothetical protein